MEDRLLTVQQVADILRLSRPTIYRMIKDGKIDVVRVSTKCVLIRESTLKEFLDERTGRG